MAIKPCLALQLIGIEEQTLDKGYRLPTNAGNEMYVIVISKTPLSQQERNFVIKVISTTVFGEFPIRFETSNCIHANWNVQSLALIWDTCELGVTKDCKIWNSGEIGKIMTDPELKKELWANIKCDAKS
ncbi:hypothetical protein [Vibrio barjaei]|uniref:hypothetical protein n=1 Tax=Vibrio barjaei TaxID=1676683 RepID=UPI002284B785|nr:hypothetical protein [Vibrio barjaei]MCY9870340.1 hypothetical protein [Vibrio barjaei]